MFLICLHPLDLFLICHHPLDLFLVGHHPLDLFLVGPHHLGLLVVDHALLVVGPHLIVGPHLVVDHPLLIANHPPHGLSHVLLLFLLGEVRLERSSNIESRMNTP